MGFSIDNIEPYKNDNIEVEIQKTGQSYSFLVTVDGKAFNVSYGDNKKLPIEPERVQKIFKTIVAQTELLTSEVKARAALLEAHSQNNSFTFTANTRTEKASYTVGKSDESINLFEDNDDSNEKVKTAFERFKELQASKNIGQFSEPAEITLKPLKTAPFAAGASAETTHFAPRRRLDPFESDDDGAKPADADAAGARGADFEYQEHNSKETRKEHTKHDASGAAAAPAHTPTPPTRPADSAPIELPKAKAEEAAPTSTPVPDSNTKTTPPFSSKLRPPPPPPTMRKFLASKSPSFPPISVPKAAAPPTPPPKVSPEDDIIDLDISGSATEKPNTDLHAPD